MVGQGSSFAELVYGSISGMAFGLISPAFAMPFDTIKTKMQAEAQYRGKGPMTVTRSVISELGLPGLYRGMLPILASTGVQKTVLFAANSGARRACENSRFGTLAEPIPYSGGLKPAVIVGGIAAAGARTVVETPFELMKVRRQTGGTFRAGGGVGLMSVTQLAEMYTGAAATFSRAALMLGSFFVLCDYTERYIPELASRPLLGGFFKGGVCATAAWFVAWPFELVKSRVQGAEGAQYRGQSTLHIVRSIAQNEGVINLYRGFVPGAARSFVANGVGMAVYQFTQSLRSD